MRSVHIPGSAPRLLCFHGTGGDEHDLVPLAQHIAPGHEIRSYRGISDEGGMLRWFPRSGFNVFDVTAVRAHLDIMLAGLREELSDDELRASVFLGYSNGANAIAALLQLGAPITRAILLHPMQVLDERADLSGAQVFVSLGERDEMISTSQTEKLVASLKEMGASVTLHRAPGGHGITSDEIEAVRTWMSTA